MDRLFDRDFSDNTLAESSVTIKLLSIQQRCKELLDDPDETLELSLEEPEPEEVEGRNPYDRA